MSGNGDLPAGVLDATAESFAARDRGEGPAARMMRFVQPLLEGSTDNVQLEKALNLLPDDQAALESRALANDMVKRHRAMFPAMHRDTGAPRSENIAGQPTENKPMPTGPAKDRHLLVTMTNEPFQPVRLYYHVALDRALVLQKLAGLRCVVEAPSERCWQWLFHAEAASLRFPGGGYDDVPENKRPIVLGRVRFPEPGTMTLETNSLERAIAGARFFAPRLGPAVVAMRCRLVNRCFAAHEGQPDQLMTTLDQNVTVIDPRVAEAALERRFAGVRSTRDAERAAAESVQQRLERKDDVPMVEDFPLAPEEETPDFTHLATGLQFRLVRAVEHWRGNTDLTLAAIIVRTVEQSMRDRSSPQEP